MSRKNVISLDLFDSDDASVVNDMSTDCLSREIETKNLDKASIHCSWSAGPTGALEVQAQNNENDSWFTLESGAAWSISGSDSEAQIILNELPFTKIRLKYVASTGSGTLTAYLTSKSVGA